MTPMMRQYFDLKEKNPDCLLFFRLGDFYELFFEDAQVASRELELTLTGRSCGQNQKAPMCGVPHHSADNYIAKLIEKGYKVAICEQLEDPELAKGLVERGVVRIITPGTATDLQEAEGENRFILAAVRTAEGFGAAYADVSTGEFLLEEAADEPALLDVLVRIRPKEVLLPEGFNASGLESLLAGVLRTPYPAYAFEKENAHDMLKKHFKVAHMQVLGVDEYPCGTCAAGALLRYLYDTQKNLLDHMTKLSPRVSGAYMPIDAFTKRNMELTQTMQTKQKKGSLLWLLDKTRTAMGARRVRSWIEQPLSDKKQITDRLDAVEELKENLSLRAGLRTSLQGVYDIERLLSRISYMNMDARHALSLCQSMERLPEIREALFGCKSAMLKKIYEELDPLPELCSYLQSAISEKPPIGIRDGGIIAPGFSTEVDRLRDAQANGRKWIASLEAREREKTGIKSLKVGYNKVFGYYIEVTRTHLASVPYDYVRKQTLAGAERYITQELKELEETVTGAQEKCCRLEAELFARIRERIAEKISQLQKNAALLADLDALESFAQAAYDYGYVRPQINTKGVLEIRGGRHPVVERTVRMAFVPNDTVMDDESNRILVITGPNMAGKSTFMRQTGLIVLMAHMGSFVPAASANICMVDRVFTRVGASDDLASGQSTFMVEMNELAAILLHATPKSLLILDEIGRGTSTQDGLAIAWATVEHIAQGAGGKTLFATHFHELTDLEGTVGGVVNYSVGVREYGDTVIFLHKIKRGGADRSFGVEVARLAGLPEKMLGRASELLGALQSHSGIELSKVDTDGAAKPQKDERLEKVGQMLRSLDINTVTPLEALSILNDLKGKVNG